MGGVQPIVVSPYDAELYGHWWYEGPLFLDFLLRKVAYDQRIFRLATPGDYLRENPEQQLATPPLSSLGRRRLRRRVARRLERLDLPPPAQGGGADDRARPRLHASRPTLERRALNQAARELLLAQSSDWAFIMKTGTMVEYAIRRTKEHVLRFTRLHDQIRAGQIDPDWLAPRRGEGQPLPRDRLPAVRAALGARPAVAPDVPARIRGAPPTESRAAAGVLALTERPGPTSLAGAFPRRNRDMRDSNDPRGDDLGATEREIIAHRVKKAEALRALGVNPFGNGHRPDHLSKDLRERYGDAPAEEIAKDPGAWSIAGRVLAVRPLRQGRVPQGPRPPRASCRSG